MDDLVTGWHAIISMTTTGLITNLMVYENNYLLFWTVPKKMKVLLAFSLFPTYSDLVLLQCFPLYFNPSWSVKVAVFLALSQTNDEQKYIFIKFKIKFSKYLKYITFNQLGKLAKSIWKLLLVSDLAHWTSFSNEINSFLL